MSPMKITEVVTTDVFAGTERYVVEVSRQLARRGHSVTVVGGDPAPMIRWTEPDVRWLPGASTREAVRSLIRGGGCDVVHSHMTKADYVGAMTAPVTRAGRVSTRHITAPRGHSRAARALAPLLRRSLHAELTVSEWTSQQLERPADVVLLNGVRAVPDGPEHRERLILVAQRLAPEKDTATAIRAFATSGLAASGWDLTVAGNGDEQPRLERLASELGVAHRVSFPGWVDDVPALYDRASMLLAPAATEPCGLTVIEAMAHGLPVIAAAAGGHLETVGQHSAAALFEPGDAAAAARHLVRLADDPQTRRAYGSTLQALQRDRLTIEAHVDRLEAVYRDIARRRAASR